MNTKHKNIGPKKMRALPKILIHEHLDCSLRPATMLKLWGEIGFDKATLPFPRNVLLPWQAAQALKNGRRSTGSTELARQLEAEAASRYQRYLVRFASKSLANYVKAIVDHVLPVMQTSVNLHQITRERLEDAAADGVVGLELRFAPQLHTMGGLTLDQVMEAVVAGIKDAPMPVKLIVCSLRHEGTFKVNPVSELVDLAIRYRKHVGVFDLAADEHAFPGVLPWWAPEAMRARAAGIDLTIHLWETEEPTDRDVEMLEKYNLRRLGHGIRGNRQGDRVLEICPTSNVVTGQVRSIDLHPIDWLYRQGKKVTVNTDGTLFTRVDLTAEYVKLQRTFGWGQADFYKVNLTALEASCFEPEVKAALRARLDEAYIGRK